MPDWGFGKVDDAQKLAAEFVVYAITQGPLDHDQWGCAHDHTA